MASSKQKKAPQSSAEAADAQQAEPGSIAYTVARLARWCRLAPQGLARVEFGTEYARQAVLDALRPQLQEDGICFHEMLLPTGKIPEQLVKELVARLYDLEPGVVSLSGFETAFPDTGERINALRLLNANRENLALRPLRQIWWMTPSFADTFLQAVPDLDSWFMVRLQLTEPAIPESGPKESRITPVEIPVAVEEARHRAGALANRFQTALRGGAEPQQLVELALDATEALVEAGLVREAGELQERLFDTLTRKGIGPDCWLGAAASQTEDASAAATLHNLAFLYLKQGRYAEAESLFQRALQVYEKVLPPSHPALPIALNNLASLYRAQDRLTEAEPLYLRALEMREQALGPSHPDIATSLNNLAGLYRVQGRFAEAEPLYRRALQIREQVLGPLHPDTATSLNDLALLYRVQGRLTEAEPLYLRALQVYDQALGTSHPNTATSLANLADVLQDQGRLADAEPLYLRALQIREQMLGPAHPDTALSLNNLAFLRQAQRRLAEAEVLFQRALAICEQALGSTHPHTESIRQSLIRLQEHLEAPDAARVRV